MKIATYEETAMVLRVAVRTLYGWTSEKKLPDNVYLGRGRFNLDALENHVESNTLFKPQVHKSPKTKNVVGNYRERLSEIRAEVKRESKN